MEDRQIYKELRQRLTITKNENSKFELFIALKLSRPVQIFLFSALGL